VFYQDDSVISSYPVENASFAANCLNVVFEITTFSGAGFSSKNIQAAIRRIIGICDEYNIDICFHVEAKMKYNATRPIRHGKAY
jgi:hypothetical protein